MMLGSQCSPCCDKCPADGLPRTDPKDEGTWVPSGTWPFVTWTFQENPGDESGETWFFLSDGSTGEVSEWGNLCNWFSARTTPPSNTSFSGFISVNKRATRLPPENATVHIYSSVSTEGVGGATVARAYFWGFSSLYAGVLTATETAHNSAGGTVFTGDSNNRGIVNGGATFTNRSFTTGSSTVNGGASFNELSRHQFGGIVNGGATFTTNAPNEGTVNDGATFFGGTNANTGIVNGGATFNGGGNRGTVNGGATFDGGVNRGTVNGGATFYNSSQNFSSAATVNGGATFNDSSGNYAGTVNGGATFNDISSNGTFIATVNDGAIFNDSSVNYAAGTVNGGATFNGAACSLRFVGSFFSAPCSRKFVAHPTDLPVCNGTALSGCDRPQASCGCG